MTLEARLQEMLDHYEIRKTLSEYCNGSDRANEARMASVYVEDSWDDHGDYQLPGPEFAQVMAAQIAAHVDSMYHLLGQSLIDVNGEQAGAETYFHAVSKVMVDDGIVLNHLGGRFVDHLTRTDDGWKIKNRQVVRDWTITMPVESEWSDAAAVTPGLQSNDDPSFAALGITHPGPPSRLTEAAS